MKKACALAALMAASILIANSAAPADGKNRKVMLINHSSGTIKELYASPITSKGWEENMLAQHELLSQHRVSANIDNGTTECNYDLKIVLATGKAIEHRGMNVCALTNWVITDSGDAFNQADAEAAPAVPTPAAQQPSANPAPSHSTAARLAMVRAQQPQTLVDALRTSGYAADLGVDRVGDPMITSAVGGTTFQIFFYNCKDHLECATVQFHSGYNLADNSVPLDSIDEWNRTERFARAYLDKETDPILEMDVDLDDGGQTPALFVDNIEYWASAMSQFERRIGFRN
jgi:hypothetical protein